MLDVLRSTSENIKRPKNARRPSDIKNVRRPNWCQMSMSVISMLMLEVLVSPRADVHVDREAS